MSLLPPLAAWYSTALFLGCAIMVAGFVLNRLRVRTLPRYEDGREVEIFRLREDLRETERLRTEVHHELVRMVFDRDGKATELERARFEAEKASRAKSVFLAGMSHELRTPLNSVIGFSSQLLKNGDDRFEERDRLFLRKIHENGIHLLGIIDDILDLSKIEAGKMDLELETASLADLVVDVVGQLEGQTLSRSVELHTELPPEIESVPMDTGKVRQVLLNLVGNALKFTDEGRVTVAVRTHGKGSRPRCVEVIDEGVGIPAERVDAIFVPFEQAEPGTSRRFGGTGLGLSLCRSLCELMGYGIEVESEVGRGSTFRIVLEQESSEDPGHDAGLLPEISVEARGRGLA